MTDKDRSTQEQTGPEPDKQNPSEPNNQEIGGGGNLVDSSDTKVATIAKKEEKEVKKGVKSSFDSNGTWRYRLVHVTATAHPISGRSVPAMNIGGLHEAVFTGLEDRRVCRVCRV